MASRELVYGTTTSRQNLSLDIGSHYLGVSFKPGQSRHFLQTAAVELTNRSEAARGLLRFNLCDIAECVEQDDVFSRLDRVLKKHLQEHLPLRSRIDDVIGGIESSDGALSISQSAEIYGKSVRQLERHFCQTVGISARLFSKVIRFRKAAKLITSTALPLAYIAADLGYTDQSHMTHEFKRFTDLPPGLYARHHVAFLQDQVYRYLDNCSSD